MQLTNNANEFVLADAIRIERLNGGSSGSSGGGSGSSIPPLQVIDDGAAGFESSGFTSFTGQGHENDLHYSASGAGNDTATWTFDVTPAVLRVAANAIYQYNACKIRFSVWEPA